MACQKHLEWANLPCETTPAEQPGTSGLPELPVTTIEYNMWDQPEGTTETFGSGEHKVERIKKATFDSAGRPLTSEEISSPANEKEHKELPKITDKYNTTNGALEEQSTTAGGTTKTTLSKYNTLGQPTEYTDADGNTATSNMKKKRMGDCSKSATRRAAKPIITPKRRAS